MSVLRQADQVHRLQRLPNSQAVHGLLRQHSRQVLHRRLLEASKVAAHGNRAREISRNVGVQEIIVQPLCDYLIVLEEIPFADEVSDFFSGIEKSAHIVLRIISTHQFLI